MEQLTDSKLRTACLVAFCDDATGEIINAEIIETAEGAFRVWSAANDPSSWDGWEHPTLAGAEHEMYLDSLSSEPRFTLEFTEASR